MTERTEFDDAIDAAIDLLIQDETESFSLQVCEGDDTHLVSSQRDSFTVDMKLRQVAVALQELSELSKQIDGAPDMEPIGVAHAAMHVADREDLELSDSQFK